MHCGGQGFDSPHVHHYFLQLRLATERDSESGLDYATFRSHCSRLGRFMTPDPIAGSIANPQSLNRYAYVRNDPINLIDPLGLDVDCVLMQGPLPPGQDESDRQWICHLVGGETIIVRAPYLALDIFIEAIEFILSTNPQAFAFFSGGGGGVIPGKPKTPDYGRELNKLFQKPNCAAVVGGQRRANQLVKNLNIIDITSPGFTPRADHLRQYESLALPRAAATTISGMGSPIWVDDDFNTSDPKQQLIILIHEFRHQLFDLGEPNAETDRQGYDAFIRKEYEKIRQACFSTK